MRQCSPDQPMIFDSLLLTNSILLHAEKESGSSPLP